MSMGKSEERNPCRLKGAETNNVNGQVKGAPPLLAQGRNMHTQGAPIV